MAKDFTPTADIFQHLLFDVDGLIPVIVQEADSKDVLMFAWMNQDALKATIEKKQVVYWSRSRQCLWHKGETSGDWQNVVSMHVDCDADCLLIRVRTPDSRACHTGAHTCFFWSLEDGRWVDRR